MRTGGGIGLVSQAGAASARAGGTTGSSRTLQENLTTVTFIDNSGYDWHATVRNTYKTTATAWQSSIVKKGHCRSNTHLEFYGSCVVATN